jgi:hypothetical protein
VTAPVTRVEYAIRMSPTYKANYGDDLSFAREMFRYHREQAADYGEDASAMSLIEITTTITERVLAPQEEE